MRMMDQFGPEFGVNLTLEALDLSKGTWHYRLCEQESYAQKYAALKAPLMKIARQHPSYGYRKVTKELKERGWDVNHKVVQRLQNEWDLPLIRRVHPHRPSEIRKVLERLGDRINLVARLETIGILEVWYTDFTELLYDRGRQKARLMPLVDHTSKFAVGWAVGPSVGTTLALEAWRRARNRMVRWGIRMSSVIVHHDQDPVYTSHAWLHELRVKNKARVSFSLNGARGNTCMESFNSHFKEENASRFWEKKDLLGLIQAVESAMYYYNDIRRHASLDNISPMEYLKQHGFGTPARR